MNIYRLKALSFAALVALAYASLPAQAADKTGYVKANGLQLLL